MRSSSSSMIAFAAAALVLAGCSRQAAPASDPDVPFKITVQLDWVAEPEHGGLYQAMAKGYFKDAGLDVVLNEGGPNAFPMQKVATGQADIGQADSTNTLIAIGQGLPLVNIAAIFQNDPSVLMLHADNPVTKFEELDGKTIMARPEWAFLPYLKNKYHINFNLIPQNFAVGNFIADRNFIQQGFFTAEPFFIVRGGAKYPKFLYAWDAGFDAYTVLFANKSWAEKNAGKLRLFLAAYIRGCKEYVEGDPAPAHDMMKKLNPNDTDDFLSFSRKMIIEGRLMTGHASKDDSEVGRISRERFVVEIQQLEELGIIPKGKLTADQVMTTTYLP